MKLEKAIEIMKEWVKIDKDMRERDESKWNDYDKFCEEKNEAIETILKYLEDPMVKIDKLFNKEELRRVEKAARDKNKQKLIDWSTQYEDIIHEVYHKKYEEAYEQILAESIDNYMLAMVFTLHFCEKTRFGNDRISEFLKDFVATTDGFKSGEYNPEEYKNILKEQKIYFD